MCGEIAVNAATIRRQQWTGTNDFAYIISFCIVFNIDLYFISIIKLY